MEDLVEEGLVEEEGEEMEEVTRLILIKRKVAEKILTRKRRTDLMAGGTGQGEIE